MTHSSKSDPQEVDVFPHPIAERSEADLARLVQEFRSSSVVKHVVIDGFLTDDAADRLLADFPQLSAMPKSRDYMFSDKRELSTLDRHTETAQALHHAIVSDAFVQFLGRLVDDTVFIDPEYTGGGFHAGAAGSFLDLHTDFNIHPAHPDWLRRLNILVYLNPGWEPGWGGELRLTDDPQVEGTTVAPLFNRCVIMESTSTSFHGYGRLAFPEGQARRSIAAYAYSLVGADSVQRRTTNWTPQDAGRAKTLLARNWNRIVLTKNRFFGSGTLKNRR